MQVVLRGMAHLVVVHAPELDLSVVRPGDDERHAGVEGGPVHASVVPLQHVLHHRVSLCEGDFYNNVEDPDPDPSVRGTDPDPHVYGPPGPGSISQRYGSGSEPLLFLK